MTNSRFKFRAWDGEIILTEDFAVTWDSAFYNISCATFSDNIVIMQCTGLKDKNGKLIYESDIVKYIDKAGKNQIGVINWREFCYFVNALGGDDEGNQDIELHPDYLQNIEVIGNIYENPKLLENDK